MNRKKSVKKMSDDSDELDPDVEDFEGLRPEDEC